MSALRRGVRNTFRNATRTVGVVVILAVAVALSISMLVARSAVSSKISSVRASTGTTVTISSAGFFGFQGGGTPLSEAKVNGLLTLAHVTALQESLSEQLRSSQTSLASPTPTGSLGQQFGGFAGGGGGTFTIPVRVVASNDPGNALVGGANGGGSETLTSGHAFSATSDADVALVGTTLATKNHLTVGSTFTAWSTKVTVVGIYSAGSTFANADVIMPLSTVQRLAGAANEVTGATLTVDSASHVASVTAAAQGRLGKSADVTSTAKATQSALAPLSSVQTISTYSLIGAVVGAAIILLLSMLMIVRERRREIGVLKAIGAPTGSIVRQFVAESATFTLIGTVVGAVAGVLLSSPITSALVSASGGGSTAPPGGFVRAGNGLPGFAAGSNGFNPVRARAGSFRFGGLSNALTEVHASAGWGTLGAAVVVALLIAIVGSAVAASSVVRVRPAEVLRSE